MIGHRISAQSPLGLSPIIALWVMDDMDQYYRDMYDPSNMTDDN